MRKFFAVSLLFLSFLPVFADLSPDDIVFLKSHGLESGVVSGAFTQIKGLEGSSRTLKSSGTVEINPERGLVWNTEKPYRSILVIGDDHITQQVRSSAPVRMDMKGNEVYKNISESIKSLFFGDFDTLQESFESELRKGESNWTLTLKPRDKALSAFMTGIVASGRNGVDKVLITESNGDYILYEFSGMKNGAVNDGEIWLL